MSKNIKYSVSKKHPELAPNDAAAVPKNHSTGEF